MTSPSIHSCTKCGWSGSDLRWSAVADSFGRHAGECPACARRLKGCYVSAMRMRQRALARREAREGS